MNWGRIACHWFEVMRKCGERLCEKLLHDGYPTACVNDAAFAYVNSFQGSRQRRVLPWGRDCRSGGTLGRHRQVIYAPT